MILSSKPYPSKKVLFNIFFKKNSIPYQDIEFFRLGRVALLSGMMKLGLQKGDEILLPAYICDSVTKPLRDYGYKLVFIDIDENLNISLNAIKLAVKSYDIKAVLIVHYFGFKAKIKSIIKFCESLNIKVIEDYSHSFLSQFLDSDIKIRGDICLYSMRKTLPVIDGGALRFKKPLKSNIQNLKHRVTVSQISSLLYLIFRTIEKIIVLLRFNIYADRVTKIKNIMTSKEFSINNIDLEAGNASSQLTLYLSNQSYLEMLQYKICDNFSYLLKEIQKIGFEVPFKKLVNNCVPQGLILYDKNGGLLEFLRNRGVGAWKWPAENMPQEVLESPSLYKIALKMNQELVILPIHQDLQKKHIDFMVKVIQKWDKKLHED